MFTVSIFGSLNFGGIKSNHYLPTMKHGETGDPQLFIAVNGNQITQQSKEYGIPSELPQGISARCVIEAWSFSCIHALHDIQASCLSDAEIASVESGTSV
ncbi:hypothetical protein N5094_02575 [Shewanella putrefaciens]|uniref:hypothetical protein n=1 Tax=Shewanella putrefaciens TaxID=24 RepID=UPI0021C024C9|nr:hypothetical protein [Shewanella putrefaciens]UXK09143.1 hypothetical protein N5094_02575 [Shewanella putrefaciens]